MRVGNLAKGIVNIKYVILIHSYCLMSTHPHVVLTSTQGQEAFSVFWKSVNQGIAKYFNKKNNRKWQVKSSQCM